MTCLRVTRRQAPHTRPNIPRPPTAWPKTGRCRETMEKTFWNSPLREVLEGV
ncbi:MAG TPA: hypothetical protein VLH40_10035 [Atribacteraceae bacterium]|nr:hypothetical protein [Atribacteraceae bacterium]